jgi:hypothetical protein
MKPSEPAALKAPIAVVRMRSPRVAVMSSDGMNITADATPSVTISGQGVGRTPGDGGGPERVDEAPDRDHRDARPALREPTERIREQPEGQHQQRHQEPDAWRREIVDAREEERERGGVEADGEAVDEGERERRERKAVRASPRRSRWPTALLAVGRLLESPPGDERGEATSAPRVERHQRIVAPMTPQRRADRDAERDAAADQAHHATRWLSARAPGDPEQGQAPRCGAPSGRTAMKRPNGIGRQSPQQTRGRRAPLRPAGRGAPCDRRRHPRLAPPARRRAC